MAVDTQHRSLLKFKVMWSRARDTYAGSDEVKKKGLVYLPALENTRQLVNVQGGPLDQLYEAYLMRALFYPAVARTVAGLAGVVFAKPPSLGGVPKSSEEMFDDITLTGVPLGSYALQLCIEDLLIGRAGTLIDYPPAYEDGTTPPGARPYVIRYDAESIVNWKVQRIGGKQLLTLLVLEEEIEAPNPKDEFDPLVLKQFRVLRLEGDEEYGSRYTSTLYKPGDKDKNTYVAEKTLTPLRLGKPLNYIPFSFLGPTGIEPDCEHPPLLDLVDVNLSHYRTSADHEHGAHYTALPTPWISGHPAPPPGETVKLGPASAMFLNAGAQAGMLEFTGAGLSSLASLKDEKRQLMATLGARMLESQKMQAEAAQAIRLRHAGERSALSVLADALGRHLTQVINWQLYWAGDDNPKALVTMNPDTMEELSAQDLQALVASWQAGAISKKTLYANLEWGEWTRPGVTFEQEEQEIVREGGAVPPTPPIPELP